MSLVINTNTSSLTAQNNLTKSTSALAQATQRLSSGLKINSAKDNAAGFAISTRFTTQIGGLSQASSNAGDAISLAQTTGSALDEITSNLQAIRDLAVQSANGTFTDSDRQAIDTEVQQRLAEITRIANQTDFNGTKVLDGSTSALSFQVGANVGQTISVSLGSGSRTSDIGAIAKTSSNDISALFKATGLTLGAGDLTINGTDITGSFTTPAALQAAVTTAVGASGTATVSGGEVSISAVAATGSVSIAGSSTVLQALGLTAATLAAGGNETTAGATATLAAVNPKSATLAAGDLVIDGKSITGTFKSIQDLSDAVNAANLGVDSAVSANGNQLNLFSDKAISVAVGTGATSGSFATGTTVTGGSLASGSVGTVDQANELISRIDVALTSISDLASTLGAIQNRFTSTISNLSAESENLTSSQSTIQDADFAAETANLSKSQVLQQAGIAVLSQANSQPQQVLKLLQ